MGRKQPFLPTPEDEGFQAEVSGEVHVREVTEASLKQA